MHVSAAHHTCRMCAHSCANYDVMLTEQEAHRLSLGVWRPLLQDVPDDMPLVMLDGATGQYMLNKRADGRCVFLDVDNLCIIHKEAGPRVKPTACQFFPLHAVQAPDGIHISLNTGCRRLVEMSGGDAPLDAQDATRLLADVQAITTVQDALPLTPDITITYAEFVDWQARLLDVLTLRHADYWPNLREAAALLLTMPADAPAPSVTWQTLFHDLDRLITRSTPQRPNATALFRRAHDWLPALTTPGARVAGLSGGITLPNSPTFCASIARQSLEGRQTALHRTARGGWVALLASITAGLLGSQWLVNQAADGTSDRRSDRNPGHMLNAVLSDALDLFFLPIGQIALTEPNQQAFLLALRNTGQK